MRDTFDAAWDFLVEHDAWVAKMGTGQKRGTVTILGKIYSNPNCRSRSEVMRNIVSAVIVVLSISAAAIYAGAEVDIHWVDDLLSYVHHPLGSVARAHWEKEETTKWDGDDSLLRVGKFDLNKDGIDELIVYSGYLCGVARGCEIDVLQKRGSDWIKIGNVAGDGCSSTTNGSAATERSVHNPAFASGTGRNTGRAARSNTALPDVPSMCFQSNLKAVTSGPRRTQTAIIRIALKSIGRVIAFLPPAGSPARLSGASPAWRCR